MKMTRGLMTQQLERYLAKEMFEQKHKTYSTRLKIAIGMVVFYLSFICVDIYRYIKSMDSTIIISMIINTIGLIFFGYLAYNHYRDIKLLKEDMFIDSL